MFFCERKSLVGRSILGSVAGDDTIIIVATSEETAEVIAERISKISGK